MSRGPARIVVLPGDGTGPEVVREGIKVLNALAEGDGLAWRVEEHPGGAQYYQKTGRELDPETVVAAREADAI
ncbi:MAG: isocitrate/isopropylmalate family dehydrogenase, partial [Candidatus Lutacidiplasmatales archaeon]